MLGRKQMPINEHKIDCAAFSVVKLEDADEDDRQYWLSKMPLERWEGMEVIRQVIYGYDPATTRLQRVLEVVERE